MDASVRDILAIRSRICDGALIGFSLIAVPGLGSSLYRSLSIGWQPVMVAHIILCAALWYTTLFRRSVPYGFRGGYLIFMMMLVGVGGLWQFGLFAAGNLFLVAGPAMAAVLFGSRTGIALSVAGVMSAGALGLYTVLANKIPALDLAAYVTHPAAWATFIAVLAIGLAVLVTGVAMITDFLTSALTDANRGKDELDKLASTLEQQVKERTIDLQAEIAEHKRAEDALRDSEEKLRQVFGAVPLPVIVTR